MNQTRNPRKQKSGRKPGPSNAQRKAMTLRQLGRVNTRQHTFVRRVGGPETTISTTAGGVIASTTLASSGSAFSCPDFANAAGLYQLYRVRAMEVRLMPLWLAPVWNGVSVTTAPAYACVSPYYSNFGPTSLQGHIDATGMEMISGYKGGTFATSYQGDLDSHFWSPVSGAMPTGEQFGLVIQGTSTASTSSIVIWRVVTWYLVEFKMNS